MKRSLLILSLVLIFLMMFSGSILAQDPTPHVFCCDLSDDDCDILVESQDAMMALTSGTTASEIDVLIAGIPDAPVDELAFNLSSFSAFTIDPEITEMLVDMQSMAPEEMMGDPGMLLDMMATLYGGVQNEGEITIGLSDGFIELLTADNDMAIPEAFTIDMSIVDGVLYVNLGDLADVTPEAAMLDAWYGIDMVELLGALAESSASLDPNQLNAMSSGLFLSTGMKSDAAFDEFVDVERIEDDEIDGQPVAVFLSTFDFASFLTSPLFRDMVLMQMAQTGTPMDPEELDQTLAMVGMFAPMFLADLDAGSIQVIGLEDAYLHQTQTYFSWDLSALAALAPDQLETAPLIEFEAFSENGDFDADIEIAAPDGAVVIPTEIVLNVLAQ